MSNEGRIWFNGKLRQSAECMVHVASHALHYGSSVFEGIRAYDTPDGTMIFRGKDHLVSFTFEQVCQTVARKAIIFGDEHFHICSLSQT